VIKYCEHGNIVRAPIGLVRIGLRNLAVMSTVLLINLAGCSGSILPAPLKSGTVIDSITGKPVAGAYVLAIYMNGGAVWFGHSSSWCENTLGVYTTADGKFSFPTRDSRGRWLGDVGAIKPDYKPVNLFEARDALKLKGENIADIEKNVFLAHQDPARPKLNFSSIETNCYRAKTRQDAAAAISFLRLALAEEEEYGASNQRLKSTWDSITMLNALPNEFGKSVIAESIEAEQRVEAEDSMYASKREAERKIQAEVLFVGHSTFATATAISSPRGLHPEVSKRYSCFGLDNQLKADALRFKIQRTGIPFEVRKEGSTERYSLCVNPTDDTDINLLISAVRTEAIHKSLRTKRYPRPLVTSQKEIERNRFGRAVLLNDQQTVEGMLKAGYDANEFVAPDTPDIERQTPLLLATELGNADLIELLIAYGAQLEAVNQMDETPLLVYARRAAQIDRRTGERIAITLVNAGANPNVLSPQKESPLYRAAASGTVHFVDLLLKAKADVNTPGGMLGSPLGGAVRGWDMAFNEPSAAQYRQVAELLVKSGANIGGQDSANNPLANTQRQAIKDRLQELAKERDTLLR
jgi:ankyrin repeat protein